MEDNDLLNRERVGLNTYDVAKKISDSSTPFGDLTVVDRSPLINISGDDILSEQKDNWSDGVSRIDEDSEIRLRANDSTEHLESIRYVPYSIGYKAEAGISIRFPEAPTGDQEVRWGYWDGSHGVYFGYDADGVFTEFIRGGTRQGKTYEADWKSEDRNKEIDPETVLNEGVVTRLGLSLYNHGEITFELFARNDLNRQTKYIVHADSPRHETTLSQQNNPLRVEVDNPATEDFDVFVTDRQASLRGHRDPSKRITSEFRTGVSLSGTTWVPLISFKRKSNFLGTNVESFSLSVQSEEDIILQLRSDTTLTNSSFGTPSLSDSGETALQSDTSATAVTADSGFHRWLGSAQGGGGPNPTGFTELSNLDLRLKRDRNMTLMARRVSGADGTIALVIMSMDEEW